MKLWSKLDLTSRMDVTSYHVATCASAFQLRVFVDAHILMWTDNIVNVLVLPNIK